MYIEEVLPDFRSGSGIRRESWPKKTFIQILVTRYPETEIGLYLASGKVTPIRWSFIKDNLLANDWEVYYD